jgi:hypothetical protein
MTRTTWSEGTRSGLGELLRAGLIAAVLALIINQVIRVAAVALLNTDPGFEPLTTWVPVTIFTVGGVVGATLVYGVLRRLVANPKRVFTIVALVVLLLSFIPNIMLGLDPSSAPFPGVTWPNVFTLMLMHLPPAIFSLYFLTRT